jgi:7-keto-8-aminopelargonate synthetase-like enzyme
MPKPVSSGLAVSGQTEAWADTASDLGLVRLLEGGLLPSKGAPGPDARGRGLDFARQDYLGLAGHPAVRSAVLSALGARRTADDTASHPDGTTAFALASRLAAAVCLPHAATFASGTEAIRQSLAAVLCPGSDLLIDAGAPRVMFETARAARAQVHRFPSGSVDAVERRLSRLSRTARTGRLVIAVSAVSAHSSKIAELAELAALARATGALLVVDVSHDLGAMGPDGGGVMEIQGCLGRADIVLGSLGKCFGADGGFAAFRDPDFVAMARLQARPLDPVSANALLAGAEIAFSPEGRRRRRNLHGVALRLRNHLMADGARLMGQASPLVPVLLPPQTALPRTALLTSAGPQVTLLLAPNVPLHAPRWRIELNAHHGLADIDDLAELIRDVARAFDRRPTRIQVPA